nr:hypothetical protein GCM10020093_031080 [Planobispora longispora]
MRTGRPLLAAAALAALTVSVAYVFGPDAGTAAPATAGAAPETVAAEAVAAASSCRVDARFPSGSSAGSGSPR